jgi:hypothetical protein
MSGGTFGTNWLDLSSTSNRYTRTYIQGFMDISGGNLIVRNNNLYLTQGDASINGNLILGRDLSVNGNVSANVNSMSSLIVSNNINMNGVVAQFSSDIAVPSTYVSYIDLSGYLYKTSLTSYSLNNINIMTPFYADADVSFNSRLFLTDDASFNKRLFVGSDSYINELTLGKGSGNISTNTAFGVSALSSNTNGSNNVALGYQSLKANTTGDYNVSIGVNSLVSNTDGNFNLAVGNETLYSNTTGGLNVALGHGAGSFITTGVANVAVGVGSLKANTSFSCNYNIAVGENCLRDITSGSNNTAVGSQAGYAGTANTTGSNNTYIGYQAQANANNYSNSTALGSGATITGSNQVVLGTSTEKVIVVGDASLNKRLFVGSDAVINGLTVGRGNGNTTYNSAFGVNALANATGDYNTAIGYQTLLSNTTGNYNTAIGCTSLTSDTTGVQNTAIGAGTLQSNTSGSFNTAIGFAAGTSGTANTTGSYNTYIGPQAQTNGNNYSNSTAIGYNATITASNQIVLGTSTETVRYNKLSPLYTSVPTYTSSDIGYIYSQSVGQTLYSSGTADFITISNLAAGVYIVKIDMLLFDPGAVGVGNYINIEIRKSGTTLTYTSKAFGGLSTTSWVNSPLSLSAFLTSSGTDSITVNRSSNINYNAYWYFQYIRIA